ncbi:FAD/FMN-containing dehydrogenase [Paenibacillus thiaminolyticus]|uniref:FAD/FMN-containing dehydrogenase n=1 Tax=Paenibacillus thiaminolyticus TaxID=49283 RepID=A0A3A3GJR3_PANTH|nr:FAD/FMN-containing dehydrogenase [Paenibacillus thiaminolyticus]RJG22451.1 FAD/FMN-containing dehydrogenase [Paenibacillus thiaminolyticus]
MKKVWLGITTVVLVMGIGTAGVYAASADNNTGDDRSFFEQMLPHAKQMHPELSDQQIEQMYNSCHNGNGTGRGMMNNSQWRGSMMNFN